MDHGFGALGHLLNDVLGFLFLRRASLLVGDVRENGVELFLDEASLTFELPLIAFDFRRHFSR